VRANAARRDAKFLQARNFWPVSSRRLGNSALFFVPFPNAMCVLPGRGPLVLRSPSLFQVLYPLFPVQPTVLALFHPVFSVFYIFARGPPRSAGNCPP